MVARDKDFARVREFFHPRLKFDSTVGSARHPLIGSARVSTVWQRPDPGRHYILYNCITRVTGPTYEYTHYHTGLTQVSHRVM